MYKYSKHFKCLFVLLNDAWQILKYVYVYMKNVNVTYIYIYIHVYIEYKEQILETLDFISKYIWHKTPI